MGKTYHWLKLQEDFFKDRTVKKIHRSVAGGDTYIILYLKMLLQSLKSEGHIFLDSDNPSEDIALDLDEDKEKVSAALEIFKQAGFIILSGDSVYFPQVEALTGSESDSARRVRKHRANQKALQCNTDVTPTETASNEDSNKNVTPEIELDIEIDKDITISKDIVCQTDKVSPTSIQAIVDDWNTLTALGIPAIQRMVAGSTRYAMLKARIQQYSEEDIHKAIDMIRKCAFLQGKNRDGWTIDFAWFIKPNNFPKVLEGNYLDRNQQAKSKKADIKPNAAHNFHQRDYDYDALEKDLLNVQW